MKIMHILVNVVGCFVVSHGLHERQISNALPASGSLNVHQANFSETGYAEVVVADEHTGTKTKSTRQVQYLWLRLLVCGLFLGSVFGMMGGGGALISKPMLYYVFHIQPFKLTIFTTYVMLAPLSLLGVAMGQSKGCVIWWDVAMLFVFTSLLGVSLGSLLASLLPDAVQLVLFALLIIAVAAHMWWKTISKKQEAQKASSEEGNLNIAREDACANDSSGALESQAVRSQWQIVMMAVLIGVVVGTLGVGGGFLLSPLLCQMGHTMETAVPTSMAVVLLNSLVGVFWYHYLFAMVVPSSVYTIVASLVFIGGCGILASGYVSSYMSQTLRQKIYACLLIFLGLGITFIEGARIFQLM